MEKQSTDKPGGEARSSTPPILPQCNLYILLDHKMFPSSPLLLDTQATLRVTAPVERTFTTAFLAQS